MVGGGRFLRLARKDICMPRTGKLLNILNIKHVDRFPRDYIVKQITVFQRKSHVHKNSSYIIALSSYVKPNVGFQKANKQCVHVYLS